MLDARNWEKYPQNGHHFKWEINKTPLHYTSSRFLYQVRWYNIVWRSVEVCGRNRKTLKQTDTHKDEIPKVKMKSSLCLIIDTASFYIILHTTSYRMFFREVTSMAVVFSNSAIIILAWIVWYYITIKLENIALRSPNLVSVTTVTNIELYFNYKLI